MCTHPNMCAAACQLPPPVFICIDCYDTHGMRQFESSFTDIVLPSETISVLCGNKVSITVVHHMRLLVCFVVTRLVLQWYTI